MTTDVIITAGISISLALLSFILYHIRNVSVSIGSLNVSIARIIAENANVTWRLTNLESSVKEMRKK